MFNRRRRLTGLLAGAAALTSTFALAGQSVASATTSSSSVTYTAIVTVPVPPASNYAGAGGGDGWGVALTPTAVYNVFHHNSTLEVECHLQANAQPCWPVSPAVNGHKTITDGSGNNFYTNGQPGMWIDQGNGHLYLFATRNDQTVGVVCIDTTQPASTPDPFCGFTQLSQTGAGTLSQGISNVSNPVSVGGKLYVFNYADGATAGASKNQMLCFDETTLAACASQPYAVNIGAGTVAATSWPPSGGLTALGNQLVFPVNVGGVGEVGCYNVATHATCAGTWPVLPGFTYNGNFGAPVPLLTAAGAFNGFCLPNGTDPCWSLTGAHVATPAGMTSVITDSDGWNSPPLVLGPRVLVPNGTVNGDQGAVQCFDYSTGASCKFTGGGSYPKTFANLGYLYSVNPDPQRPTCVWVNADDGTQQIQNFDAYTGGPCGSGDIRVLASAVVAPNPVCTPGSWSTLQVVSPTRNKYSTGTVAFEDNDANPLPGVAPANLDATGSVDLTNLNLQAKTTLPQFVLTLSGINTSTQSVVVKLTWQGTYDPSCLQPGTTSTPPLANGMMLLGADGGLFAYGNRGFVSAAGFQGAPGPLTDPNGNVIAAPFVGVASNPARNGYWAVDGAGQVYTVGTAKYYGGLGSVNLHAPIVGIAATPSGLGYWLVASDGGVFTFGDAVFHGSLGNVHLNRPIVGIASTLSGNGYYLAASDGGVFTFGDAVFHGSAAATPLNSPVVGIVATRTGSGYYLVASDGGVFTYGDAVFYGSTAGVHLNAPVVAIGLTSDGKGYWEIGGDGGVFTHGDAPFLLTAFHGVDGPLVDLVKQLRAPLVGGVS